MPNVETHPFTTDQLNHFEKEINKAGDFDELMIQKQALKRDLDMIFIVTHKDIEKYKEKYLVGVYEALRPIYNIEVPYTFWGFLYSALQKRGTKTI